LHIGPVHIHYNWVMPRLPKPGGAVFVPHSLADNRKKFGKSTSRLTAGEIASPQQEAAEVQHAIANRIREYLLDQNTDLFKYCAQTPLPRGLSYDRFQRIFRGETMMTLTDLMFWAGQIPDLAEFAHSAIQRTLDADHVEGRYASLSS
jgi:hypothetical protein